MKVKDLHIKYNGLLSVGEICYYLNLGDDGIEYDVNELHDIIVNYKSIMIGGKIYDQLSDLVKLIKKVNKNHDTKFYITIEDANIEPKKISSLMNTQFLVLLTKDCSNKKILEWYNNLGAKFIYYVDDELNVSDLDLLITTYELKKHNCFISTNNGERLVDIFMACKLNNINFCPDFGKLLFDVEEKQNEQQKEEENKQQS